jgi:hypothetical protein
MKAKIGGAHALTATAIWIGRAHHRMKRKRGEMIASVKDTIATSSNMAEGEEGVGIPHQI